MTTINLHHIAKVEGHAKLDLRIEQGKVKHLSLDSFEGARFFEAIVQGREYKDIPTTVSRICGICSSVHYVCALKAIEKALGIEVSEQTKLLRELLRLGELVRSHASHLYFLALPDYLGYSGALDMAKKYPEEIKRTLALNKLGNDLVTVVGGREIHPLPSNPGSFDHQPCQVKMKKLLGRLKELRGEALATAELFSKLKPPKFERKTQYYALSDGKKYQFEEGEPTSLDGKKVPLVGYKKHFSEHLKPGRTAKFALADGQSYFTGALARVNINCHLLSPAARSLAEKLKFPLYSPFANNLAQGIELVHCFDRAIEILAGILEKNEFKIEKGVAPSRLTGVGIAVSEAPRGLLFHEYELKDGKVVRANIITPTVQNLKNLEEDLKEFIPGILNQSKEEVVLEIEKLIRAYDPCFSCSTHFLEVRWL